jgi:hypothetical protein
MTTPDPCNVDVAAYALGVLNEVDTETFEFHLVWCETCAGELERLLPAATALAQVDGAAFTQSEQAGDDGQLLDELMNVVALRRRRIVLVRTLAVAAAVVLVVLIAIVGAPVVMNPERQAPRALPSATAGSAVKGAQVGPSPSEGALVGPPGIGGPDVPVGEQLSATDPVSEVRLDAIVSTLSWGTQLTISLTHVAGPLDCELYAVDRVGSSTVLATWRVDRAGYGTAANPDPLLLSASTSIARTDMVRLFVRSQAPNEAAKLLVSLPM